MQLSWPYFQVHGKFHLGVWAVGVPGQGCHPSPNQKPVVEKIQFYSQRCETWVREHPDVSAEVGLGLGGGRGAGVGCGAAGRTWLPPVQGAAPGELLAPPSLAVCFGVTDLSKWGEKLQTATQGCCLGFYTQALDKVVNAMQTGIVTGGEREGDTPSCLPPKIHCSRPASKQFHLRTMTEHRPEYWAVCPRPGRRVAGLEGRGKSEAAGRNPCTASRRP